jgi:hypothetical protein
MHTADSCVQEVDKEMATAYAEEIGALYLETSAKDDTNVQDIFVKLSKSSHSCLALSYTPVAPLFPLLLRTARGCAAFAGGNVFMRAPRPTDSAVAHLMLLCSRFTPCRLSATLSAAGRQQRDPGHQQHGAQRVPK